MSQKYFTVKNALIVMSVTYNQSSYVTKSIQMETHRNATIKFSTIVIIILLHNIFGRGEGTLSETKRELFVSIKYKIKHWFNKLKSVFSHDL